MNASAIRFLKTALVFGALAGLPAAADAQFQTPPNSAARYAPSQTQATTQALAAPPAPSFGYAPPAWGAPGWGAPYNVTYNGPAGSYLNGVSNVIGAQGQYQMANQQARIMNEQAKQSQIQTQQMLFEQQQWEKANTPTANDLREQERAEALRRARHDPPLSEITSAIALNAVFDEIRQVQTTQGLRGPMVPLYPEIIRLINLTDGTTRGSTSLFTDPKDFSWPLVLERDEFARERKALEQEIPQAVDQLKQYGRVPAAQQNQLRKTVGNLKGKINDMAQDLTPDEFIRGMRFTNQLTESIKSFDNPNAANFYNGKWQVQANNVGGLVEQMVAQGLKFAPAAVGSEAAYRSLYSSLLSYDSALAAAAGPPPQQGGGPPDRTGRP
jgi:hypothetical protein